jgi:hypothetical protein
MIPAKIKSAIEANPELNEQLLAAGMGLDWKKFNRTVFDFLARRINRRVTHLAMAQPVWVTEKLLVGKDQLHQFTNGHQPVTEDSVVKTLSEMRRPFSWVSGKTLHSYWNKGKAKETKLNVLLTYLEVPLAEWDDWKSSVVGTPAYIKANRSSRKNSHQELIRKYFLGSYFLYYQKSDGSRTLVKAPFSLALDEQDQLYAQTVTEGHPYRSSLIELREGILYIHCENQLFDEKENHIFNVGNETHPEVLFGVSNTISVKKKLAIGIRNVLIRQKNDFTENTFVEKELSFDAETRLSKEETLVLRYFLQQGVNLITSPHCCPMNVLEEMVETVN